MTNFVKLKDITTKIGSGATPRGGEKSYKKDGISLIRSINVHDFSFKTHRLAFIDEHQAEKLSNVQLEKNDILLNITGASVARCCMVPSEILPGRVNQHVSIIRVNPDLANPQYVLCCITSPYYKSYLLNLAQGGATREALTKTTLSNFEIPLPPLETQEKIAYVLSAYNLLIENNKQRINILEEIIRIIYGEWFVNFRFPGYDNVNMIESEQGIIPEGWNIRELNDIIKIHRGKSYKSSELVDEGGLPFINLKCINRQGGFREKGLKRFIGKFKETQIVKGGDIVVAITDMTQKRDVIGRPALVPKLDKENMIISLDLVKIEPKNKDESLFIYGFLRYTNFGNQIKEYATGVNVLHLNPALIGDYPIIIPPSTLINKFTDQFSYIYDLIDLLHLKNKKLRQMRDLILPKFISGDLNVENLDIVVEMES